MNKHILCLFLFALSILPTKTLAWGKKGHALVAEVSFNYLDKKTKDIVFGVFRRDEY